MSIAHSTAYERGAVDSATIAAALADSTLRNFWEDEAGPAGPHPALTSSTRADLTIIGGGYTGLWTAVHAKRRDPARRVVLLEAETVGWAASGRNGGFCDASLTHGEENGRNRWPAEYDRLHHLGEDNLDAFDRDVRDLELKCQWERTGTLTVAVEEHQVSWLGSGPDVLDRDAVRAQVNSPLFLAGVWRRDGSAIVQPLRLARELARVARDLGVEIFENSAVTGIDTRGRGPVTVHTARATVTTAQVVLATNAFPALLRRNRLMTVPVYDYVLVTEPLSDSQMAAVGWANRQGLSDMANQFHYSRVTEDNRILYGGYDAIYHAGRRVRAAYEDRSATYERLASHFLATFPQLEGLRFTHRWGGAIDTSTQFSAFFGLARRGRVAYAQGFTGLGVGATRFAGEVMLDLLDGADTERTRLAMVRKRPLPFPPEPAASIGINLTRWSLDRADHRRGRRNLFLRTLDAAGLGFDS
ncbi:NAD(P)/FAD-dependent oxidoreductase [Geodermatophilus nigrescens]